MADSKGLHRLQNIIFTKRYARSLAALLLFVCTVTILFSFDTTLSQIQMQVDDRDTQDEADRLPPTYAEWHERERTFPQHNETLPPPDGRHAKLLWISNHAHGSGWGNIMQELIMNAHLAFSSERAFVFHNYTWDRDGPEFIPYNGKLIPSRIPLSAFVEGPLIGDLFRAEHAHIPRAVSRGYFKQICPNPTILDRLDVPEAQIAGLPGQKLLDAWVKKIKSIEDRCVMIAENSLSVFDVWIFGELRILDMWPSLTKSPVLTQFGWSELIRSGFEKNLALFNPSPSRIEAGMSYLQHNDPYRPIPHLLSIHVRRGDFETHCGMLGNWSANWNAFNRFPTLPDQFDRPLDGGAGFTTPQNMAKYMLHCFPTIDDIVRKVTEVRASPAGGGLKNIYIMTNAPHEWIDELSAALKKSDKRWKSIKSSRDLKLNWEQKYVKQAVDMMAGQKAQVFIGNGFSSLTSNIVVLRMHRKIAPQATRLW